MDGRRFEDTGEQIVPEPFDLHILHADQSQVDQHIQADQQLYDAAGMFVFSDEQEGPQRDRTADITEVKQIEDVVFCQPQRNGDRLEDRQHQYGSGIFFHCIFSFWFRSVSIVHFSVTGYSSMTK